MLHTWISFLRHSPRHVPEGNLVIFMFGLWLSPTDSTRLTLTLRLPVLYEYALAYLTCCHTRYRSQVHRSGGVGDYNDPDGHNQDQAGDAVECVEP